MDVVVIGAGMGGLSAAIALAAKGAKVTVLERNERVGGKLNIWRKDGFTFDTGPHMLTMPWAIEEVFAAAGRSLKAEVELVPLDTICRYHFPDTAHTTFDAAADPKVAARNIEALAPGSSARFHDFLAFARRISKATTDPFLRQDFGAAVQGIPSFTQFRQLASFLALRPWRSLRDVVGEYFTDPRLQQIFELYALYSGSHPARCSGIFATVADVQWRQGTYYIEGGISQLAQKMSNIAQDLGVKIYTSRGVSEIIVRRGRAVGVTTDTAESILADNVVCNSDALTAITGLLPARAHRRWTAQRVERIEPSTSAFVLLLGISGSYPQLAHHNAFLSADSNIEYEEIFDKGVPASDPTVGVACQTVTDPSRAPAGCSNLFIMTNPPPLGPNYDWTENAPIYRDLVLDKLEAMGLPDLRERILVEQLWTPQDLKDRYGAWRGAIYGPSSNGWRNAFLRPPQVSPDVQGLYFVGGSTHPGGGLPLCALSGTHVARRLLADSREA